MRPGSSDPFYIASILYKMGHYFLDTNNIFEDSAPKLLRDNYCDTKKHSSKPSFVFLTIVSDIVTMIIREKDTV